MKRRLQLSDAAEEDYRDARWYYEDRETGLGRRLEMAVEEKLASIRENPELYAKARGEVREASVSRFPYAIYFTADDRSVIVVAVFHTSRDPSVWQSRVEES